LLTLALSEFEPLTESTLGDFKIDGDRAASQLIHSLGGCPGQKKLCSNHTGTFINNQVTALSNMLQHPNFNLTTLELSNNIINPAGWQAIFATLEIPTCRLQKLDLHGNVFGNDTMISLANSLVNNTTLSELNCTYMYNVTGTGWQGCTDVLVSPYSALVKLDICFHDNDINDATSILLLNTLSGNCKL